MACESACFDCPFLKIADNDIFDHDQAFDYWFSHMTESGGYQEIECEEQGDLCFGQIQSLANGIHSKMDPFSNLGEAVEEVKPNRKDFFAGGWEFLAFYGAL